MENNQNQIKMDYKELYNGIKALGGISALWGKMLDMIKTLYDGKVSDDALKVFCLYFSLIDDGNTCICLDKEVLAGKWKIKYDGLLIAAGEKCPDGLKNLPTGFIEQGVKDILANRNDYKQLFQVKDNGGKKWLFIVKYASAVSSVSNRLTALLKPLNISVTGSDKDGIKKKFNREGFVLNDEQAEAIVRGEKGENLIISGCPGTGKTTVVCYLLWQLIEKPEYKDYAIYLAAPSGKAQDRLKEAVDEEVDKIGIKNEDVRNRLLEAQGYTIHRLLSFNPKANSFSYNKNSQFAGKSIFVIDEASMVDICLFQSLLEAIPDGARVFILGDPYQLPSVQAGAVLGDVLRKNIRNKVELKVSNRFKADSVVGKLSARIKEVADAQDISSVDDGFVADFTAWQEWKNGRAPIFSDTTQDGSTVEYISRQTKADIEDIASRWAQKFYDYKGCCRLKGETTTDELNRLWNFVEHAKILSAEREGVVGVENLNMLMCKCVSNVNHAGWRKKSDSFFVGEQLIVTQNQRMYNLYNGDCGVVVSFEGDNELYFMTKKPQSGGSADKALDVNASIKRKGDYLFYPLYVIPSDSIDMAFAITIHKSQGSGYDNIMIFIPEKQGHPLLNNQIVYTAITRTKGYTYIVGTRERLQEAIQTRIERDTLIEIE